MTLDGVLQHTGDYASNVLIQTKALDAAIQEFFNRCEKNTTDCGSQGKQMRQLWANGVDKAATGTLQAPGCDDTPQTGCFRNVSVQDLLGTARGLTESPTDSGGSHGSWRCRGRATHRSPTRSRRGC